MSAPAIRRSSAFGVAREASVTAWLIAPGTLIATPCMQQFIDSGWDASAGAAASAGTGSKSAGGSTGAFTGGKMYQLTKTGLQVGVAAAGTKVWKDKDLN